jgi:hypothetical protein
MDWIKQSLKQNFWPISAIIFCPCHLPLTLSAFASLTAGTFFGAFVSSHYNSIESVLAVAFSFYFVLAFMIWVVRGPKQSAGTACLIDAEGRQKLSGLSTKNIVVWGVIGMLIVPALVSISVFAEKDFFDNPILQTIVANTDYNSGLIWLISITIVVMIPVMVIWLVWLWLAWVKTDRTNPDLEEWHYEYE